MSGTAFGASVRVFGATSLALLVALLPKCPACLGAYLAIASSIGLDKVGPGALQAITITGLAFALLLLGRAAARRDRWIAFVVACGGAAVVVSGRLFDAGRAVQIAGVVLLYGGALRIYWGRLDRRQACHSM